MDGRSINSPCSICFPDFLLNARESNSYIGTYNPSNKSARGGVVGRAYIVLVIYATARRRVAAGPKGADITQKLNVVQYTPAHLFMYILPFTSGMGVDSISRRVT